MSTITTKDGTQIYYKDWGTGPAVTFSHGWPLNADMWDGQMLFLAQNGFRVIAHDRRGHGRSSQASSGNDMNGYADDLAAVIEALDLKQVTLVGHSTGGGEVARYIGRHGTSRVAKAVLIAAVPPLMLKTAANPEGLPIEVFDGMRASLAKDRSQYYKEFAVPFYGANRPGAKVSQGSRSISSGSGACSAGLKNALREYQGLLRDRLHRGPQEVRCADIGASRRGRPDRSGEELCREVGQLIKGAKEIYYPGAPHGITATHQDQINADLLAFIAGQKSAAA